MLILSIKRKNDVLQNAIFLYHPGKVFVLVYRMFVLWESLFFVGL